MWKEDNLLFRTNTKILLLILVLVTVTTLSVSILNLFILRSIYEDNFTSRMLLSNTMMASMVNSGEIDYYVDLMRGQNDDFKKQQAAFYRDREALAGLLEKNGSESEQKELLARMEAFHAEMNQFKSERYWTVVNSLRRLKELSRSTYVYVFADTGVMADDGTKLYTYIFDAEDDAVYVEPGNDGLGTVIEGEPVVAEIYRTKKPMETALYYSGTYGDLYYAYAPVMNTNGSVVAILGTDMGIDGMKSDVRRSMLLFNTVFLSFGIMLILVLYLFVTRYIVKPLEELTVTAQKLTEGDVYASVPAFALRQSSELGTLARAIKDMSGVYQSLIQSTGALFEAAKAGKLDVRNDASNYKGDIKKLVLQINETLDIAEAAAKTKSDFLSRMSHEMRTPMNAIIGMARIAESTDDVLRLKHCIDAIGTSSNLLLGIINDVLDMSKIEAGKFDMEHLPVNIEKILMKICTILAGNMEQKKQKFDVILGKNLCLDYMGDELRLSQVITNLLSNAIKFTPENGKIILKAEEVSREGNSSVLRFSVLDTGIGMTKEEIGRLFHSFEQADGSITRRFGGTGLGLVISKNIVEKMGGTIRVESEAGSGSTFVFDVRLERASLEESFRAGTGYPSGIKLLLAARDGELQKRFLAILESLGIKADTAGDSGETLSAVNSARNSGKPYHVIFINQDMLGGDGFDVVKRFEENVDRRGIVVISSFMEWNNIEKFAVEAGIGRYITNPLFPSAILDVINECVGEALKTRNGHNAAGPDAREETPDFSGVHILLAEDVEINREIFLALLSETRIVIDTAENGRAAVEKFREDPAKYDVIIMDIQMPEMDGYEATKLIRAMDVPNAGTVPVIALTANAFKEDIERCLACGMNDHLSKPIDEKMVIEKIKRYSKIR